METVAEVATTVSDEVKITALFHLENISFVTQTFCGDFEELLYVCKLSERKAAQIRNNSHNNY